MSTPSSRLRTSIPVIKSRRCCSVEEATEIDWVGRDFRRSKKREQRGAPRGREHEGASVSNASTNPAKTEQADLICIPAHTHLPAASGGSLISHNWRDGFFKTSLWCEGLTFVFWSNYIIVRPSVSGAKRLFNEKSEQCCRETTFCQAIRRLARFEVSFSYFAQVCVYKSKKKH